VATAARVADEAFPDASVWSVPSLKPLDAVRVELICRQSRALVTFEEHSVYGGLGSLIAELSTSSVPRRILRLGVSDRFSEYCGSYEYLLVERGLDEHRILEKIGEFAAQVG
jgi:transketolase